MKFKKIRCDKCKGHGEISPLVPLRKELDEKIEDKTWTGESSKLYPGDVNDIINWLFKELKRLNSSSPEKVEKK